MGLFSLFGRKKQIPFETTIHLSIPLDDGDDPDDLDMDEILSNLEINVPPGMSIEQMEVTARIVDQDEE